MADKRPLFFRKRLGGLRPSERGAEEALAGIKEGEVVRVDIKRPRNIRHHRKYWALLTVIADNLDNVTPEVLHEVVKLRTGYVHVLRTPKGEIQIPASVAFGKMDQAAFEAYYDAAVRFIVSDVLPGIDRADLEREVLEFMA